MSRLKNLAKDYPGNLYNMPFLRIATGTGKEFNHRLQQYVLYQERRLCGNKIVRKGSKEGLVALWETYNVLKWPNKECKLLHGLFLEYTAEYMRLANKKYSHKIPHKIQCWANVTRGPSMAEYPHYHNTDPLNIVGVYYVSGEYHAGGNINFFEKTSRGVQEIYHLSPKVGDLLLFPATVLHGKGLYLDNEPRISVAFDLRLEGDSKKQFIDFFS